MCSSLRKLLPAIHKYFYFNIYQQHGVPKNLSRVTIELLQNQTPDVIQFTMWPPNSPDIKPVDYNVWWVKQELVYGKKISDVDELWQRILDAWDELDQCVIDASIKQWRVRFHECIRAEWVHFEHQLTLSICFTKQHLHPIPCSL